MNKRILFFTLLTFFSALNIMAQDDDMYFTPKKRQPTDASTMRSVVSSVDEDTTPAYYCGSMRSVDEYNRRGRYRHFTDSVNYEPDSILVSRQDYENAMKLKRFDGYHSNVLIINDPWYYDPWYYDSWYWHTRWYDPWYDPWYGPHYYGWHSPYYYSGWYHPYHWGGWYGPVYYGHSSTWVSRGVSRGVSGSRHFVSTNRQYNSDARSQSNRNTTVQRGNTFDNRSFNNTQSRNFGNNTTSIRSNSFGGSGNTTRSMGGGISGGGMRSGGVSHGGGFSGGGHRR